MKAKGQVIDSKTKEMLPNASIVVTTGEGNAIKPIKKTSSDKDGLFTIDVFPSDFLTISYIGYFNKTVSIKDFSSDVNIINLNYNKSDESTSDLFKGYRGEQTDNGVLKNKGIKWYYWVAIGVIGYYVYTKVKK
tara:strand:- start:5758 stop:6159 length:402 start_codon:yes stop_codon:yes gene_type:complete